MKRRGTLATVFGTMAATLLMAVPAQASTGVKLLDPDPGQTFPVMTQIRFSAAFRGPGQRYMRICSRNRRDGNGKLCSDILTEPMIKGKRRGKSRVWYAVPKLLPSLPSYYQNTPGTYYWQASRIACNRFNDCVQESKVRSFKIR
jgi:hypothetical protein